MNVSDISPYDVYFVKRKCGWYDVLPDRGLDRSEIIGSVLKVKNATSNAQWVFLPIRAFRRSAAKPYRRFCFGCSRRVAVSNYLNDLHLTFQTGNGWRKSKHVLEANNARKA